MIIHTILGIGSSRFARYMAGCVCEHSDIFYNKIEDYNTTRLMESGIKMIDAQMLAHQLVFENRTVDDTYLEQDENGIEGKGPQFSLTSNGDVYFSGFHGSLNTMYADQQIVLPDMYDSEEHKTVLSAYEALRNGATQAAHIVHHYNEKGELDVRDVVVLTYDHETNTGQMHILNISQRGKNHQSLESAHDAMQKRLGGFEEKMKADSVFLFVREEKPIDPLSFFREKINSSKIQEANTSFLYDYLTEPVKEFDTVQQFQEVVSIVRTVVHVDTFEDDIPYVLPRFLEQFIKQDEKDELWKRKIQEKKKQNDGVDQTHDSQETVSDEFSKETFHVATHFERQEKKFLEEKKMQRPDKKMFTPGNTEMKRRKDPLKQKQKITEKLGIIFSLKEKSIERPKKKKRREELQINTLKKYTRVSLLIKVNHFFRKESVRRQKKQEKTIHPFSEIRGLPMPKKEQKQCNRILTMEYVRAFIVFSLLKQPSIMTQSDKKNENNPAQNYGPWVLLSIVWYMTMMREQGRGGILPKKKKKKKKNRFYRHGLIYAYKP